MFDFHTSNARRYAVALATLTVTCIASVAAQAAFVTSRADLGGQTVSMPAVDYLGPGPQSGPGYTWSSSNVDTQGGSVFGYTGFYGFGSNGSWSGIPMAGVNDSFDLYGVVDSMRFTFDNLISGFGGDINWVPNTLPVTIATYDAAGILLESVTLSAGGFNLLSPDSFYGFKDSTADIKSFVLTDGYAAIRNMDAVGLSTVPLPAAAPMFGLSLLALGGASLVRKRRKAVASA